MTLSAAAPAMKITLKHGTEREARTKAQLERVLSDYDLSKYTFTREVVIEEQAINHAFPVLTLNVRAFADSEDELLSSFVHEQLHWHLRDRGPAMQNAVAELRRVYPHVPVGGQEGAETEYSTYGHLVDCYLELVADRKLIGPERTAAVVADKGHYTWIYATVIRDDARMSALVNRYRLAHRRPVRDRTFELPHRTPRLTDVSRAP
jgi:hypothetical protein